MTQRRYSARDYVLLHATLLLYSVVSVFAKSAGIAMVAEDWPRTLWSLGLEALLLGGYAVLWQLVLKRMPLTLAYSSKAVCVVWTFLFGMLFFGETITWGKAVGAAVALLGVWLVVSDHE